MRLNLRRKLPLVLLTTSLFSAVLLSQPSQTPIRIIQRLDDGSIAVEIDGLKYLAITPAQLRSWTNLQTDADGCKKISAELTGQVATLTHERDSLKKDVTTLEEKAATNRADFERAREDTKRNFELFQTERVLRVEAQQFIPHKKIGGVGGKVLDFLDSGYGQSLFKIGIPVYQSFRCS